MKKLLQLGSNEGIAGEFNLTCVNDVLRLVPFTDRDKTLRKVYTALHVNAVLADGSIIALTEGYRIIPPVESKFYAPLREDAPCFYCNQRTDANCIGKQICGFPEGVVALELHRQVIVDEIPEEDITEVLFVSPSDKGGIWWHDVTFSELDWKKIRRRVEDALRKTTDKATLFNVAQKLGVKIYA